jgi:HD-GYP domain-containing protein (c-di-GMP phosphodiesterase class II)
MANPPPVPKRARLAEVLSALSYALDLTEGQPVGHCVRSCWIGLNIGRELGLPENQIWELYYVLLLKDLGCSSNAARICQLYLADDIAFKRDFKQVNGSLPQALRFVLSHTGLKAGLAERFRAIINVFQNGGEISHELIETRCQRGADIARKMRFGEPIALGIKSLDEHWDGTGKADGLKGEAIPLYARIALLAQVVDVFQLGNGQDAARRETRHRAGSWFDPLVVSAFERVASRPEFWLRLGSKTLQAEIFELEPGQQATLIDDDYLDDIAAAFAQVVDSKSPFTSGHSERVTLYADMIAEQLGLASDKRRWLKRAALLHDIGKLGVSNSILDKPGRLNAAEWAAVHRHPALSEEILARISIFDELAAVAGAHHERLDGKGYPNGLSAGHIALDTRIITAADIFDALTADRPYRKALSTAQALAVMEADAGTAIDRRCLDALKAALVRIEGAIAA